MNEDLFPIKLPPGLFRNGTRYQAQGRWYDANLIRFQGDRIQPWGGWQAAQSTVGGSIQALSGVARSVHVWAANDGSVKTGLGTHTNAYVLIDGTLYDITPLAGFTAGEADSDFSGGTGGFGGGLYGGGAYGTASLVSALDEADTWSLDNFGDFLVGCLTSDGKILVWDGNTANNFAAAAGAPTGCSGLFVTPERFLVAIAPGGNKRLLQWPDQETTTSWTPGSLSKAGDFEIATTGRIRTGARSKSESLIWTDVDLWTMNFIGGTLVYSFRQVGDKCGIIGPNAKIVIGSRAFWMGRNNFHEYNGTVRDIPCEVHDYVFTDINELQLAKVWGLSFAEFGEVVWFYCSANATEIDRYVSYNYREDHWNAGTLARVAGYDSGVAPNPILCERTWASIGTLTSTGVNVSNGNTVTVGTKTYTFQTVLTNVDGNVFIGASAAASLTNLWNAINLGVGAGSTYAALTTLHPNAQAETLTATTLVLRAKASGSGGNTIATTKVAVTLSFGAATLTNGGVAENGFEVSDIFEHEVGTTRTGQTPFLESGLYELDGGNRVMKLFRLVPDEKNTGDVRMFIYTVLEEAPNSAETLTGPYTMASPTDLRLTTRYARFRYEEVTATDWRVGITRVGMRAGGRR